MRRSKKEGSQKKRENMEFEKLNAENNPPGWKGSLIAYCLITPFIGYILLVKIKRILWKLGTPRKNPKTL